MPKNPPQCGEQNPLMWGFIPHGRGRFWAWKWCFSDQKSQHAHLEVVTERMMEMWCALQITRNVGWAFFFDTKAKKINVKAHKEEPKKWKVYYADGIFLRVSVVNFCNSVIIQSSFGLAVYSLSSIFSTNIFNLSTRYNGRISKSSSFLMLRVERRTYSLERYCLR